MNILNGSKTDFTFNGYNAIMFNFDIYNDSNYWDSSILGSQRDLWFSFNIGSTDLYLNNDLHCSFTYGVDETNSFYSNFFVNNDTYRDDLPFLNMNYGQFAYSACGNDTLIENSSLFTEFGSTFSYNDCTNLIFYLWYENDDLYIDDGSLTYCNYLNTPFFNVAQQSGYQSGYNTGYTDASGVSQKEAFNRGWTQGSEFGSNAGYMAGYSVGYDEGQTIGYQSGYETGYDDGENFGQNSGYDNGYTVGYEVGSYDGYQDGYNGGYNLGYDRGHLQGIEDANSGDYDLSSMVVKVADTPINLFKSIFDIEFMGINLVPIIFGLTSLGIAVWLVRRFMGGD